MSTDDTGSWAQPNPTDRTEPDFVDITRLAPATDGSTDTPDIDSVTGEDVIEIADADLVAVDVDDVSTDDVADEDIAEIMAGFEQRSETTRSDDSSDDAATEDADTEAVAEIADVHTERVEEPETADVKVEAAA